MAKVQHKKWLTYLLMAVTVLLLLSATAYAADDTEGRFEVDDNETLYFYQNVGENMPNKQDGFRYEFKYELNQADHTATLVVANSVNSAHYADAELTVLETITYQGTDYTVTTIGEEAFRYSQVKILHLPDTITTIEKGAFIYCYYVEELDIPAGVTSIGENAFWRCHVLKEVVIPQGVTVIPDGAFSQCWAAESLVIPDGVTSIGE